MISGGSFEGSASATVEVAAVGSYSVSSTPGLVADVQGWLDNPASNFGWALVIDSAASGSAKRFNSRENGTASSRPTLTISYESDSDGPTAGFSFSPAHPRPGDEVHFSDESMGEPTSWLWDFGDGQTSDQENPSHSFTSPGSKTVTLTASNSAGTDTTTEEVLIASSLRRPSRRVAPGR